MKKYFAGLLVIVTLAFVMVPGLAMAADDHALGPKLTADAFRADWNYYWDNGPVESSLAFGKDVSYYAWEPVDGVTRLFGVLQYKDSKSYVGTTRYNQRNNPYNSAYPYNEAIFS